MAGSNFDMAKLTPNPRLTRAVERMEITGNDYRPVDTLNNYIPTVNQLPPLPSPKKKKLIDVKGKLPVSYQLRYLYIALSNLTDRTEMDTSLATVRFSAEQEEKLLASIKKPANAYGELLSKNFKKLLHPVHFFLVLERGKKSDAKRLHAHMVLSYNPNDRPAIEVILKRHTDGSPTSVMVQETYELKSYAPNSSFKATAMEMADEYNNNMYEREKNSSLYKRTMLIDIGIADYMSKQLEKMNKELKSLPFHASRTLRAEANKLYEEAYRKQQLMKAQEKAAAKKRR